jgi:hypothetical protein
LRADIVSICIDTPKFRSQVYHTINHQQMFYVFEHLLHVISKCVPSVLCQTHSHIQPPFYQSHQSSAYD